MKRAILIASLSLANSYTPNASHHRLTPRLQYKTHEFEYGSSDDRVRLLTSDDRVSALKLLETQAKTSKKQHLETLSSRVAPTSIITQSNNDVWSDVDADRSSLAYLLEPPAPPLTRGSTTISSSAITKPPRLAAKKSTITSLHSIQDYTRHILSPQLNQLSLIRISAPWCQVCRSTNVAYERMAAKLSKDNVAFYSLEIDSSTPQDTKNTLKDYLRVAAVPTGVLYHPSRGIVGRVNLNRSNLNELKKRLEGYVSGALHRQGEMMWMEALVMGLEVEKKG